MPFQGYRSVWEHDDWSPPIFFSRYVNHISIKEDILFLPPPCFEVQRRPCILTHPTSLRYYVAGLLLSGSAEPEGPEGPWSHKIFGLDRNKTFFLKSHFSTTGPSNFWIFRQSWVFMEPRAGLDTVKLGMVYKKIARKQKHKYFFDWHKSAFRFLLLTNSIWQIRPLFTRSKWNMGEILAFLA